MIILVLFAAVAAVSQGTENLRDFNAEIR